MILYHGTNTKFLVEILEDGLYGRSGKDFGTWGKNGHQDGGYPSIQGHSYLTTAYAPYFANCAVGDELDNDPVVLEIDMTGIDEDFFWPDEDFIGQGISHNEKIPLAIAHKRAVNRLSDYKHYWKTSLEAMGCISCDQWIPPRRILRIARFNVEQCTAGFSRAIMITPLTPLNYQICGDKYRGLTAWLFGDRQYLPEMEDTERWISQIDDDKNEMQIALKRRLVELKIQSANHAGITVEMVNDPIMDGAGAGSSATIGNVVAGS